MYINVIGIPFISSHLLNSPSFNSNLLHAPLLLAFEREFIKAERLCRLFVFVETRLPRDDGHVTCFKPPKTQLFGSLGALLKVRCIPPHTPRPLDSPRPWNFTSFTYTYNNYDMI